MGMPSKLYTQITKYKKLQVSGKNSLAIIIPSTFIKILDLDRKSRFITTVNTITKEIILRKIEDEEVSHIIAE